MDPTQISFAVIMVGVAVVIIAWLQSSRAAASARHMTGMMARFGLDSGAAELDSPQSKAVMKDARQRCRRCSQEDLCERWLAGTVKCDNTFCPNAQTFRILAESSGRTS